MNLTRLLAVKDYNKLTTTAQKFFKDTYLKHIASMGEEEKEKHAPDKIKKIKWNKEELCFEVYFEHEWYKYYLNGSWG